MIRNRHSGGRRGNRRALKGKMVGVRLGIGPGHGIHGTLEPAEEIDTAPALAQGVVTRPDLRAFVMESSSIALLHSLGLKLEQDEDVEVYDYADLRYTDDEPDPDRELDDPSDEDSDSTEPEDHYRPQQGFPETPRLPPEGRQAVEYGPPDLSIQGDIGNLYVDVLLDRCDQTAVPKILLNHINVKRQSLRKLGDLIKDKIEDAGPLYFQRETAADALLMLAAKAEDVYASLADKPETGETYATRLARSCRISLPRFGIVSFSEFLECCVGRREYQANLVRGAVRILVESEYRPNPWTQDQLADRLCRDDTWEQFWTSKGLAKEQARRRMEIDRPITITGRQVGNVLVEMGYSTRASRRRGTGLATKD